jgi:hypothetical protein
MADRESDLPLAEVRRLKGVAAWSGDALRYTLYNGTEWRVTEVYVRIGRFQNDDLREDPEPFLLLPAGAKVDAGVADLLSKVAPDRKKAGLNPFDTGIFEARLAAARGFAARSNRRGCRRAERAARPARRPAVPNRAMASRRRR